MGAYSKSGSSKISGILKPGDVPPTGGLYLLDIVPDGPVRFGFPNINDNAEIAELIASLDRPTRQVLIEARIVEAEKGFSRNLGVKLSMLATNEDGKATGVVGGKDGSIFDLSARPISSRRCRSAQCLSKLRLVDSTLAPLGSNQSASWLCLCAQWRLR